MIYFWINYLSKFLQFLFLKELFIFKYCNQFDSKDFISYSLSLIFPLLIKMPFIIIILIMNTLFLLQFSLSSNLLHISKNTLNIPNIIILLNLAWIDIFFSIRLLISIASFLHKISFIFTKISPFDNFLVKLSWTPFIRVISQKKIKH